MRMRFMDHRDIEVIFWDANAKQVRAQHVPFRLGLCVSDVLQELAIKDCHAVGIYGKVCKLADQLAPGDRLEIYEPLILDPKASRIIRMKKNRGDS